MTASPALPHPGATDRTAIRRIKERAVHDRDALHAVLDAGVLAHVAVVDTEGQPFVLPVAYARRGDDVLFHGSTGSRLFRRLAAGAPTCLTVTLLDGLVLARSAFESSMNYRSVMVLGMARELTGDEQADALDILTDHLLPGRRAHLRPTTAKERAATLVLALPLAECSVKIRTGGPEDPPEDVDWPVWAGEVPMVTSYGVPVAADDLGAQHHEVPDHVRAWVASPPMA